MKKVVIIEQDNIVSNLMLKTMEMYTEEKIRVDIFSSMDAFAEKYIDGDRGKFSSSESPDPELPHLLKNDEIHKEIDLVFMADEFLGDDPKKGIEFLLKKLSDARLSKKESPSKLIFLGYYYEDLHLQEYEQNGVVDFIFKPIDQQLLLQKLEIAFKLGEKVEPSFLVKAQIEEPIAIGKLGKIEEISEFGLAIRNPKPIKPGQFARFYSKIFFCKESPSLLARCYMNIPHPTEAGQFLVYFSYFGIRREQLLNVRKAMQRDSNLEKAYNHNEAVSSAPTTDNSNIMKHIVVIDNDPNTAKAIEEVYKDSFSNVAVHSYNGYTNFMAQLNAAKKFKNPLEEFNKLHGLGIFAEQAEKKKKKKKKKDDEENNFVPLSERYRAVPMDDKFQFEVSKSEGKMFRMELESSKEYDCFGYEDQEFKNDPELWKAFIHDHSKEEFDEFIEVSMAGQQGRIDVWGISKDTSPARIRVEARHKANSIQLSISDITHQYRPEKQKHAKNQLGKIYAIYLDGALIRSDDKPEFMRNLRKMINKSGLKPDRKKVKIIILGLEDGESRSSKFEFEETDDFFYRPIDRSLVKEKMMLYVFPFEDETSHIQLDYFKNSQNSVLSTDVQMVEVSEHGIAIRYKIPFKEGTYMRFISKIFYLDNGDPLIGRCYFSEKEEESETYVSFFEFFGVTDEVFKRIRVWIRENYVQNKNKNSA